MVKCIEERDLLGGETKTYTLLFYKL